MPGLGPGIHVFRTRLAGVDGRDKPGHDAIVATACGLMRRLQNLQLLRAG